MGSLNEFLKRVGAEIIRKGSIILMDRRTVMAVLDICAAEQVRVLGIEAFFVQGEKIIPVIDAIGDFSNAPSKSESVKDARSFVQSIERPDLMFELELQDR
jgi:hypothetical protein